MDKVILKDLNIKKQIHVGETSEVYELSDGKILKVFTPFSLLIYNRCNIKMERKILEAKSIVSVPEIIVPESAVYNNGDFCGYISKKASGIDYNEYDDRLSLVDRSNLKMYADDHAKLESIVKRGNEAGIVFPDLCTCDNIFVDANGEMSLIDYDGLQIGDYVTPILSTSLGDQDQYYSSKYYRNGLFTPELDKKSLIILYFLTAFNVNLNTLGMINPATNEKVTLDFIFEAIGLDDYDIQNKVWKCLQTKYENEFLGDDVYHIADYYDMVTVPVGNRQYFKQLIKK